MQGLGAPACAKLLTQWYSSSERGTAWSIWTASNNVGGFAAPWIAGTAAGALGWRWGMWVPAAIALSVASIVLFTITDKPTDKGFAPVDSGASKKVEGKSTAEKEEGPTVKEILLKDVLPNPFVWLFAISYFFVYLVRQGASTWFVHYIMNVKGVTELSTAAAQVSGLEVGGFFGALSAGVPLRCLLPLSLAPGRLRTNLRQQIQSERKSRSGSAGTLSDVLVRRAKAAGSSAGLIGMRVRVVLTYGIFTALALLAFSVCPNTPAIQWASIAAVGFGLYGPQMLIGLCGAEVLARPGPAFFAATRALSVAHGAGSRQPWCAWLPLLLLRNCLPTLPLRSGHLPAVQPCPCRSCLSL